MAKACGATRLMIYGDSYLVVQQTMKSCDAISDSMIAYRDLYNILEGQFDGCELRLIGRNSNDEADSLANIGSTRSPIPSGVFLEIIHQRSIKEKSTSSPRKSTPIDGEQKPLDPDSPDNPAVATAKEEPDEVLMVEPTWMQPFLAYMIRQELSADVEEARRIAQRSKAFTVIEGELYK
ncbi:uncharacterized protein LOC104585533 [Brachypodium distachyon]|uniref:uncharacterized protein LOC104585533 n=1 Tax=Brachypodium distachyon TaxID=15368 RepID=UPI00052FE8BA|nr:uncharacterized protein LOC104585533 [Brachypodium distachyon]|eukprot:XP_010240758.1 uncharacterized protein LOC104585533 [Brachypodium distachyon]